MALSDIPLTTQHNRERYRALIENHSESWINVHNTELDYIWGQIWGFGASTFCEETQIRMAARLTDLENS